VLNVIEFVKGDVIRDCEAVESFARDVDVAAHLAVLIDVAKSVERFDLYFDVNIKGTYNIAKASKNIGITLSYIF